MAVHVRFSRTNAGSAESFLAGPFRRIRLVDGKRLEALKGRRWVTLAVGQQERRGTDPFGGSYSLWCLLPLKSRPKGFDDATLLSFE